MTPFNAALRRLVWFPVLLLLAAIAQVVYWAQDDDPPFTGGKYIATPTRAGEGMQITREVKRDLSRTCSVTYTRYLLDGAGQLHDMAPVQRVSPLMRQTLDRVSHGRRDEVIQLPKEAAAGKAQIVTDLNYSCNPWQKIFPIYIRSELIVEILP